MSEMWTVSLERERAPLAGPLRLRGRIEARLEGSRFWLRGSDLSDELSAALRKLPGAIRYRVLPGGRLLRDGTRIPRGKLPGGSWRPLESLIRLEPQAAALPGETAEKVKVRLVRSEEEREARAILSRMEQWSDYALGAPEIRLQGLEFAAAASGRVLILATGETPLPPVPGLRLVEEAGLFWPCGLGWSPAVGGSVIREVLALQQGEIALFQEDGTYQCLRKDALARASRSAVRQTGEGLSHGG